VNEDTNNEEWEVEVVSAHVEVKKDKNMNGTQTSSARKMWP
jgi:hypothetical protein